MEPIIIKDLSWHAKRASLAARMGGRSRRGIAGIMFANHPESLMERPALRGYACFYGELFERDGILHAFVPGCFTASLAAGHGVDLRMEHEEANVFGNSRTGLWFVDTAEGLSFEFEPPRDQRGAVAVSLVASRSRTDVSVGTTDLETTVRNIRGHQVRLITKARLVEISLCKDGAVKKSHARIVDLAEAMSLEDEAASGILRVSGLGNDLMTASKRLRDTVEAVHAPPPPRSYAVHHIWPEHLG